MGESTWPRGCFLPLHISRASRGVWGVKERNLEAPETALMRVCWNHKANTIPKKPVYTLAQIRDQDSVWVCMCVGEGGGRGYIKRGKRKWWQVRMTTLSVWAKRGVYFIYLHCKLYSAPEPHRLLYSLKQFCPGFHYWKQTELWITNVSWATAERMRELERAAKRWNEECKETRMQNEASPWRSSCAHQIHTRGWTAAPSTAYISHEPLLPLCVCGLCCLFWVSH